MTGLLLEQARSRARKGGATGDEDQSSSEHSSTESEHDQSFPANRTETPAPRASSNKDRNTRPCASDHIFGVEHMHRATQEEATASFLEELGLPDDFLDAQDADQGEDTDLLQDAQVIFVLHISCF